MTEPRDMSQPVTRQELHDSLEVWGGALRAELRAEVRTEIGAMATTLRAEMAQLRTELRTELGQDLARWANTIIEALRADWRVQLEPHERVPERVGKLEELPARVERLEARVFAAKRAAKRPAKRASRRR